MYFTSTFGVLYLQTQSSVPRPPIHPSPDIWVILGSHKKLGRSGVYVLRPPVISTLILNIIITTFTDNYRDLCVIQILQEYTVLSTVHLLDLIPNYHLN